MDKSSPPTEGLRERKRRETLHRIAETGLELFVANGYDATTLDAIAEAAGISRRTFFYYFKSKEDILLAWQDGIAEGLRAAVREQSPDQAPLDAVRNALLELTTCYSSDDVMVIDRLLHSTEALRAAKQGKYVHQEEAVFAGLCELWPQPERAAALRLVAMMSIGAMRLAMEAWSRDGGKRPISDYLTETFADLKSESSRQV